MGRRFLSTVIGLVTVGGLGCEPPPPLVAPTSPVVNAPEPAPSEITDGELSLVVPRSASVCFRYPPRLFDEALCPRGAKPIDAPPVQAGVVHLAMGAVFGPTDAPAPRAIFSVIKLPTTLTHAPSSSEVDALAQQFIDGRLAAIPGARLLAGRYIGTRRIHGLTVVRVSMDLDDVPSSVDEFVVAYLTIGRRWEYVVSVRAARANATLVDALAKQAASTIEMRNPVAPAPPGIDEADAGVERGVAGVEPNAAGSGMVVSDADAVVVTLRPQFKACYQAGLDADHTLSGNVVVRALITPDGAIDNATVTESVGLTPEVGSCLERVVKNARFKGLGGHGSVLRIPITFVQQAQQPR